LSATKNDVIAEQTLSQRLKVYFFSITLIGCHFSGKHNSDSIEVSMPSIRKHRSFISLSRRKRRQKVIQLKNRLRNTRHIYGGIFYDECDIDQYYNTKDYIWNWSDIYFLGLQPDVLWNAEIITTQTAFNDVVGSLAFEEAYSLLNTHQREEEFRLDTMQRDSPRHLTRYAIFNGLTFSEYLSKREQEIALNTPIQIYSEYRYLPGYSYGIGLKMIVDAPALNVDVIEAVIRDFRRRGESEWQSNVVISTPSQL